MNKPLNDYTNRCGSCKNFIFLEKNYLILYRGTCSCKNRRIYHQASKKACKQYVSLAEV